MTTDDTQAELDRIDGNIDALGKALKKYGDRIDDLEARVSDIAGHIELVDASLNTNQKGKIEKITGILDYIEEHAAGGPSGKTAKTGEVAAASGASRDTALRLMDELAANFAWCEVENPGGPRPKQLRVRTGEVSAAERREAVRAHYAEA